jgi:hypothetical protein
VDVDQTAAPWHSYYEDSNLVPRLVGAEVFASLKHGAAS